MKCRSCGEEFDVNDAAAEFNSHFDDEHDYYYEGWEGICADCAISNQELDDEEGVVSGDMPLVCASCGGNYPLCADSCNILED